MNRATAVNIIAKHLTPQNELVFTRDDAVELARIATEALAEFSEDEKDDEIYQSILQNKTDMEELVEAYDAMGKVPYAVSCTFPLMISLDQVFHPEEGIISTPVKDGLQAIIDSGNWPEGVANIDTVLGKCVSELIVLRKNLDDPKWGTKINTKILVIMIGRDEDNAFIKNFSAINQLPVDPTRINVVLGIPKGEVLCPAQ